MGSGASVPGLGALQLAHRACTRCVDAGFLAVARPVFSGRADQRILLVGQAPGRVEDDLSRPFAGRAGRQLMRWMERGGFTGEDDVRRRIYMTAMTTCFPGRTPDGRGDRRPSAREVALCAPWLDSLIELLQPRLVIPVGTLALERFLPGHRLDDAVGRIFDALGSEAAADSRPPLHLPLPHPSGQSRWLNDPARAALLQRSLELLPGLASWAESG
jgi:uracil-DNA glycosylase family 4